MEERMDFENFKSAVCHSLKRMGDMKYLLNILESNDIEYYYNKEWLLECFYLLGMVDYLCRKNNLPYSNEYNYIRQYKLEKPIFPSDVIIKCIIFNSEKPKENILKIAIPEFLRFNIVENGVYDAC